VMTVRYQRRVAVTVAASLLVVFFLVFHRHQSSSDVCSNSTQDRHNTRRLSEDAALRLRTAVSFHNRSELYEFGRVVGDVRPTDSLPLRAATTGATTTTTTTRGAAPRHEFVIHRCPRSYNITDTQDEWFRTAVVQRAPATSQVTFTDEILILTPICNSQQHLRRYFENLCSLAYPHRLISVVLGEDSSDDDTAQVLALTDSRRYRNSNASSTIHCVHENGPISMFNK